MVSDEKAEPPPPAPPSPPVPTPPQPERKTTAPRTVKLTDLLKTDPRKEEKQTSPSEKLPEQAFTEDDIRAVWMEYAQQRKKFQAEFQLLSQPFELRGNQVVVTLLSHVHETMLNNIKSELTTFLREKLKNNTILVTGELKSAEERKVIYTNREKFDYLAGKNPLLKELKDRLGLDTDF